MLAAVVVIVAFWIYAHIDHAYETLESQIDSLTERLEVLEIPLQKGQDDEKTKLATQLAEANTKLITTDFEKLKLDLKESNQQWLWGWAGFLGVIFAIIGLALWFFVKALIADRVEERLKEFQDAVKIAETMSEQLRIVQKQNVVSVIENIIRFSGDQNYNREKLRAAPEQALIDVFCDKAQILTVRHIAAEILSEKQSTEFVSTAIEFLNSIVDLDIESSLICNSISYKNELCDILQYVGEIHTQEAYDGLRIYLIRLLNENPKNKDLLLKQTAFSLAHVGIELNRRNAISIIRKTLSDLDVSWHEEDALKNLVEYFNIFYEYEGIKDVLTNDLTNGMPEVEKRCIQLLREYDAEFVRERERKIEEANTESEESNEPKPTN